MPEICRFVRVNRLPADSGPSPIIRGPPRLFGTLPDYSGMCNGGLRYLLVEEHSTPVPSDRKSTFL